MDDNQTISRSLKRKRASHARRIWWLFIVNLCPSSLVSSSLNLLQLIRVWSGLWSILVLKDFSFTEEDMSPAPQHVFGEWKYCAVNNDLHLMPCWTRALVMLNWLKCLLLSAGRAVMSQLLPPGSQRKSGIWCDVMGAWDNSLILAEAGDLHEMFSLTCFGNGPQAFYPPSFISLDDGTNSLQSIALHHMLYFCVNEWNSFSLYKQFVSDSWVGNTFACGCWGAQTRKWVMSLCDDPIKGSLRSE